MTYKVNNAALRWVFATEHRLRDRSGIYGYTQRTLAYNSNRIEGSTLTENQTAALFEEGYLPQTDEVYRAKDIEEMNGHFLMFNKMIQTFGEPLTQDLIKAFHYELKAGVFEDRANGYAIGDYKTRRNTVGGLVVADPEEVTDRMQDLLFWYHNLDEVTIDDLAVFHAKYELIHPFQDGNGRTGRMIIFREALKHDVTPFIIRNENRIKYVSALNKAQIGADYTDLTAYFKTEQTYYEMQCEAFDVNARYEAYCKNQRN